MYKERPAKKWAIVGQKHTRSELASALLSNPKEGIEWSKKKALKARSKRAKRSWMRNVEIINKINR